MFSILVLFFISQAVFATSHFQPVGVLVSSILALSIMTVVYTEKPAPRRQMQKGRDGYIYLIQSITNEAYYKIGRTNHPARRMRKFNVVLPFEIEPICLIKTSDMYALESELHARFAAKRVNGEWFDLSAEDVAYIEGIGE